MTAIEWTDRTWNPTVGCDRVSPGCDNCYAMRMARRFDGTVPAYEGTTVAGPVDWSGRVNLIEDRLDEPRRWRKPAMVFVDSMSDLFHPDIDYRFIRDVFNTMRCCNGMVTAAGERMPSHTFQVLTKRPQRMSELANDAALGFDPASPPANVWLGTSIETDRYTFRANHLRDTPASIRFLSLEPLLGPLPSLDLTNIDWVIVGGESGHGARPMDPDDVRDIRDRCIDAGVQFFFKQWGDWMPYEPSSAPFFESQHGKSIDGHHLPLGLTEGDIAERWWWPDFELDPIYHRIGKKAAGRKLDGRTWDEMPERQP